MWWLWIPLIVIGVFGLLFLLLLLLGRFRNGALLRPVIAWLSKIGFMRRFFTRVSTAAIERQNPELARAVKKMERAGVARDPQRANGPLEHRGMRNVELELLGGHELPGVARFRAALVVEIDVGPAGEPVLLVPDAFTVTE